VEQAELNLSDESHLAGGWDGFFWGMNKFKLAPGGTTYLIGFARWNPIKAYFPISERHMSSHNKTESKRRSTKHTIGFFGNALDLIFDYGRIFTQPGKILRPTGQWIQTRAQSARAHSRTPATVLRPRQ